MNGGRFDHQAHYSNLPGKSKANINAKNGANLAVLFAVETTKRPCRSGIALPGRYKGASPSHQYIINVYAFAEHPRSLSPAKTMGGDSQHLHTKKRTWLFQQPQFNEICYCEIHLHSPCTYRTNI